MLYFRGKCLGVLKVCWQHPLKVLGTCFTLHYKKTIINSSAWPKIQNRFRHLTFFRNVVLDLTSAPLTKLQYLFSLPKSGIFVQAAHQNYCTHGACSKNTIKLNFFDRPKPKNYVAPWQCFRANHTLEDPLKNSTVTHVVTGRGS